MWKYFVYKEWIKLKWSVIAIWVITFLVGGFILLNLRQDASKLGVQNVWYALVYAKPFYNLLRYIPLLAGASIAFIQFLPEIQQKRLKLTLHLPIAPKNAIMQMTLFGSAMLILAVFSPMVIASIFFLSIFHISILGNLLLSFLPWILGGLMCYSAIVNVLLEPEWSIKALIFATLLLCLMLPFQEAILEGLNPNLPVLVGVVFLWRMSTYFSSIRFEKIITN